MEGIARRQASERVVGDRIDEVGEATVHFPPVDEMFGWEDIPEERSKYHPSQSAKSLLKNFIALNHPTHLVHSHPTPSFSADQLIQFARAVVLEVSLASYSMLEDLLMKGRVGSGGQSVTLRYTAGNSLFPSVAGSSMSNSVASRSVNSLLTTTETEGTNVVVREGVMEEPCSNRQAEAPLLMGPERKKEPVIDSLKTLQQIKWNETKKKSLLCKWSRGGRLNPLLPRSDDKACYVLTEEMLELVLSAKLFTTGPYGPLKIKYCFFCMLSRRNISIKTRGDCMSWSLTNREIADSGQIRDLERNIALGRSLVGMGRVLYGSKLEADRQLNMELDVPNLDYKRPFYCDVLEKKPFTFTTEESRVRIQINLPMTILKSAGYIWVLEHYWKHVGIATGHSASMACLNWSPAHISVSVL